MTSMAMMVMMIITFHKVNRSETKREAHSVHKEWTMSNITQALREHGRSEKMYNDIDLLFCAISTCMSTCNCMKINKITKLAQKFPTQRLKTTFC